MKKIVLIIGFALLFVFLYYTQVDVCVQGCYHKDDIYLGLAYHSNPDGLTRGYYRDYKGGQLKEERLARRGHRIRVITPPKKEKS